MMSFSDALAFGQDDAVAEFVPGQAECWRRASTAEGPGSSELPIPRIALVDDDEDLHVFMRDLGGRGHFPLTGTCHNGAEALDRLSKHQPDAVVMDIRLP